MFVVLVVVEMEVLVIVGGGCEDATTNEGMGGLMIFYVKFTKL